MRTMTQALLALGFVGAMAVSTPVAVTAQQNNLSSLGVWKSEIVQIVIKTIDGSIEISTIISRSIVCQAPSGAIMMGMVIQWSMATLSTASQS